MPNRKNINEFLKELRLEKGFTQQEVADRIGIPRASYATLERTVEPRLSTIKELADLYQVPVDFFVNSGEIGSPQPVRGRTQRPTKVKFDQAKLREVLLYITAKVGAKPNVGETVLYKLLYFIDFDYYELYGESITGLTYIKNHYGPTPAKDFLLTVKEMVAKKELELPESNYYSYHQKKYLPLIDAPLQDLSASEVKHIDWELSRLSDKSARELSAFSHGDAPWQQAAMEQPIDYDDVRDRSEAYHMLKG
ncbi:MAG: DUF4065 domain-containing protein [Coriobacteriales bacterium]|nr:DUF4065 domain-containing protein [Coriobacteriales bacterium]